MSLKLIKTRYGGNCSKCGRELKPDWEIYFNADSPAGKAKEIYCKPCGNQMINETPVTVVKSTPIISALKTDDEPENLHEVARIEDITLKLDHVLTSLSVLHSEQQRVIEHVNKALATLPQVNPEEKTKQKTKK